MMMQNLPTFSITIISEEQFVALWSMCIKQRIPIRYDPSDRFFQAFPVLEEDRLKLVLLNKSFYE